jgi:hypothetical protein
MKRVVRIALVLVFLVGAVGSLEAASGRAMSIEERAKGSERIVVASVQQLSASFERNEYGDELIVSHVRLIVEETLKGAPQAAVPIDVLGGTVGSTTLRVSSLPAMALGDRAVFFLERNKAGAYIPHLKGQGILKLDPENHVRGSSLTLDDVRRMAAAGR